MRGGCHFEQARTPLAPLQAGDRSVGRPLCAGEYLRAELFPQKRPHYSSVRDDDDARAVGMKDADGREGVLEPDDDLLVCLGAYERPALLLGKGEELLRQLGVALLLLGPGMSLEDTPMPLAKPFDGDDLT